METVYTIKWDSKNSKFFKVRFEVEDISVVPEGGDKKTNVADFFNTRFTNEETVTEEIKKLNEDYTNKDIWVIRCRECHKFFILDKKEIDWFNNNNLAIPKRCSDCRKKRKQAATASDK